MENGKILNKIAAKISALKELWAQAKKSMTKEELDEVAKEYAAINKSYNLPEITLDNECGILLENLENSEFSRLDHLQLQTYLSLIEELSANLSKWFLRTQISEQMADGCAMVEEKMCLDCNENVENDRFFGMTNLNSPNHQLDIPNLVPFELELETDTEDEEEES